MKTNVPDIFSAGDVTSFPLSICGDKMVNIGHWQMSQAQGMILGNSQFYFNWSKTRVTINELPVTRFLKS